MPPAACADDRGAIRRHPRAAAPVERSESAPGTRLDDALDRLERDMILRALEEAKQVKGRAARLLGISERSLWYKLRKHSLS